MSPINREKLVDKKSRLPSDWLDYAIRLTRRNMAKKNPTIRLAMNFYYLKENHPERKEPIREACFAGQVMLEELKKRKRKKTTELFDLLYTSLDHNPLNASDLECALDSARGGSIDYFLFFLGYEKKLGATFNFPYVDFNKKPELLLRYLEEASKNLKKINL